MNIRFECEAPAEDGANYVLGFMFSATAPGARQFVAIRKKYPERHAGLLNGVGGHVEAGEQAVEAMRREAREETGLDVQTWTPFAKVIYARATMFCFLTFIWEQPRQATDEQIEWASMSDLARNPERFVSSVPWLAAMALELSGFVTTVDRRTG